MDFTISIDRADLNTSKSKGASCQHFVQNKLMTSYPRLFFQILSKIWPAERLTHYVFHYTDGYATVIHVNWSAVGVPGFVRLPLVSAYMDVNITLRPRGDCGELQSNNTIMMGSSERGSIMDLHFSAVTPSIQPFAYNLAHMSVLHVNELDRYPGSVRSFRIIEADRENVYDDLPGTVRMHIDPVVENNCTATAVPVTPVGSAAVVGGKKRNRKHKDESKDRSGLPKKKAFKYDAGKRIRGPKFINLTGVPDQLPIKRSVEGGYSKYEGVSFHKARKKWLAQIWVDGKKHHIGCYDDEEKAAIDYARAVFKYRAMR